MLGYSDAKRAFASAVDRWLGVTTGRESVVESSVEVPEGESPKNYLTYDPSYYMNLLWAVRRFGGPDDVLLDLGCGAGRAVCFAARVRRMRRCVGVEYHRPLAELAERNAKASRRAKSTPVEIHCADATTWPVPDDVTLVYMYNPFVDEVFEAAIERLIESIDRAPRRVKLMYTYPTQRDRLLATGRARSIGALKGRRSDPDKAASLTTEVFELS